MFPLFILLAFVIAYGSLYPWTFEPLHFPANPFGTLFAFWPDRLSRYLAKDIAVNVLLYAPLGTAGYLSLLRRRAPRDRIAAAVCSAFVLSTTVEILQQLVPGRTSTVVDIICNILGAGIGAAAVPAQKRLRTSIRTPPVLCAPAAVLLLCWLSVQVVRLIPDLRSLRQRTGALYYLGASNAFVETAAFFAEWLVVARAIEAVFGRKSARRVLPFLMLLIPARWLWSDGTLAGLEFACALAALLVWPLLPVTVIAAAFCFVLLLRGLAPFHFESPPAPFYWVPFRALFAAEWQGGLNIVTRKVFDYGAPVWLLFRAGAPLRISGGVLAVLLLGIEAAQRYLPGRVAEITDPLLPVLIAWVFWLAVQSSRNTGSNNTT